MTLQITCIVKICCKDHILSQKVEVSEQNEMIFAKINTTCTDKILLRKFLLSAHVNKYREFRMVQSIVLSFHNTGAT